MQPIFLHGFFTTKGENKEIIQDFFKGNNQVIIFNDLETIVFKENNIFAWFKKSLFCFIANIKTR